MNENQMILLNKFYSLEPTRVVIDKKERNDIWKSIRSSDIDLNAYSKLCPSLVSQVERSYKSGNNIQSAVFSECSYAQTFANMFNLSDFHNYEKETLKLPGSVDLEIKKNNLVPRYVYVDDQKLNFFIQAGGCGGIDSLFFSLEMGISWTIEFKEPLAKTSEPDLPKYDENGILNITESFLSKYPQFGSMLNEHRGLSFFDVMGQNIHNFSAESIDTAVSNNYVQKHADFICTEDKDSILTLMSAKDVSRWAQVEGEIRPAGRNHYRVWTPNALKRFIIGKNGKIDKDMVRIPKDKLEPRKERGNKTKISGYKINSLFFVYIDNCQSSENDIIFNLNDVQQLNPTVAGKMSFKQMRYSDVKKYYKNL